jgi:hypothetical protein
MTCSRALVHTRRLADDVQAVGGVVIDASGMQDSATESGVAKAGGLANADEDACLYLHARLPAQPSIAGFSFLGACDSGQARHRHQWHMLKQNWFNAVCTEADVDHRGVGGQA